MRKLVAATIAALVVLTMTEASSAADTNSGSWPSSPNITVLDTPDSDFTGIGPATLPTFFNGAPWRRVPRYNYASKCVGVPNTGLINQGCKWTYPDYELNCLPSPNAPAWRVLWVYKAGRSADSLYHRAVASRLPEVHRNIRGAAAMFAASFVSDLLNPDGSVTAHKGFSREPRFVTGQNSARCVATITDVPVPEAVLHRHPLQVRANGIYKPGLFAYLNDLGYRSALRNHFVFFDATAMSAPYFCGGTAIGGGLPVGMQGPYGSGQESDMIDSPATNPAGGSANWGGAFAMQCGAGSDMDELWDVNYQNGGLIANIAHEMGHAMGIDPDSSKLNDGLHLDNAHDIMGETSGQSNQKCDTDPMWSSISTTPDRDARAMSDYRFDCQGDDYWAATWYNRLRTWGTTEWSMSENAFLWGTPKPTSPVFWDIRQVGYDFCGSVNEQDMCLTTQ